VQPGQSQPPAHAAHDAWDGVPVQVGTWNSFGAGANSFVVPQQIRSEPVVQSLSDEQLLGQSAAQVPAQQRAAAGVPAQSESVEQDFGQLAACKQSDCADVARLGSSLPAPAQQISPDAMSHWESLVQASGQSLVVVQKGVV
jgi:hypothetical protein